MKFYIKLNFRTSLQKAMAQNSILLFNILQKRTQNFAPLFSKTSIDSWGKSRCTSYWNLYFVEICKFSAKKKNHYLCSISAAW